MEKGLLKLKILSISAILVINFIFYREAHGQGLDNIGFAAFNLTAKQFNCDAFIKVNKPLSTLHISFLYNTFGNNFKCLSKLLKDSRLKTIQVHLINEPGHRNRRLGSYEFLYSVRTPQVYDSLILKRDANLRRRFRRYVTPLKRFLDSNLQSYTELLVSPGLESNISNSSARILTSWTREMFPNARIVWNPLFKNSRSLKSSTADLLESHGLFPFLSEPCIFNLDGADISYPNRPALGEPTYSENQSKNWVQSETPLFQLYEELANTCEVAFIWAAESNGLDYNAKRFVDPRLRNNNISFSSYARIYEDINAIRLRGIVYPKEYIYTQSDNYITRFCSEVRENFADGFKTGNLLKQSEFRNRGGVILLSKVLGFPSSAQVYKGNVVIDTYTRVGDYKDGRVMLRSPRSPTTYPLKTYLVLNEKNSKICYKLPNPRIRID